MFFFFFVIVVKRRERIEVGWAGMWGLFVRSQGREKTYDFLKLKCIMFHYT